jgi:hypothetical protein
MIVTTMAWKTHNVHAEDRIQVGRMHYSASPYHGSANTMMVKRRQGQTETLT